MEDLKLVGPFSQLITMNELPEKGPINDRQLEIIENGGVLIKNGIIQKIGTFKDLKKEADFSSTQLIQIEGASVGMPGFIDPHTHICFAGSRANDYAKRISGKTYLEIAKEGGGIWQTVQKTREADTSQLFMETLERAELLLKSGVTTVEVKSGYGLSYEHEIKMLDTINKVDGNSAIDLISTCLAAHIVPKDFQGSSGEYLDFILNDLLPIVKKKKLAGRIDIFIEEGAFEESESIPFLKKAGMLGFDITIHGDQFTPTGSKVAIETGAISVDHLESSTDKEIKALANSNVIATVLPGASLGLGMPFAQARKLLDAGNVVAIGSDWNPGSAPMGNLLVQASVMSASEKLSNAETFAGITIRAAKALNLHDRGKLSVGLLADIVAFPCTDYREILYHQGQLQPNFILKKGNIIN
ncbi:MAG: imidazolonepropionase [Cyclobacteriaceae bacterium]|nr:imidazolonepropionase [Cyclobacteriaceae bacterium]